MSDFCTASAMLDVAASSTNGIGVTDRPVLSASQLVAHPGAHPTVTVPMAGAVPPAVDEPWAHLAEAAEFYGMAIPSPRELSECLAAFAAALRPVPVLTAVTVFLIPSGPEFVVTGAVVPSVGPAVRIDRCDVDFPLPRPGDAHWHRMAARTTSKADRDQLGRWLAGRGCVDGVARDAAVPFLGALVYTGGAGAFGIENPEPTSILAQLRRCGAVVGVHVVDDPPADVEHVWWVSPEYRMHPVNRIGTTPYAVADVPTFARPS